MTKSLPFFHINHQYYTVFPPEFLTDGGLFFHSYANCQLEVDNPYYKKRTADFRKQSTVRYENDGMTGHSRRLDVIGNAAARSSPQAAAVIHRAAE